MGWYWIILIIIGYIIIGAICAGLFLRITDSTHESEPEVTALITILWPVAIPVTLIVALVIFIYELFEQ